MLILGIEWSQFQRSMALGAINEAGELSCLASGMLDGVDDAAALAMLGQWLQEGGYNANQLDQVLVGLGPGSHAGVRHALAAAYGWHLAHGCHLGGVSSALVMARAGVKQTGGDLMHVLMDAQRAGIAQMSYRLEASGYLRPIEQIKVMPPQAILAQCSSGYMVATPALAGNMAALGVSSERLVEVVPEASLMIEEAIEFPDGLQPGPVLEPIYLQPAAYTRASLPALPEALEHEIRNLDTSSEV